MTPRHTRFTRTHARGLLALALLLAVPAAPQAADAPKGPTLALEDTMHTEVSPVLVSAPRVTLDEILDRVARGEARRDSALHDETFLLTTRVVGKTDKATPELLQEDVQRIWMKRPDRERRVTLRHWLKKPPKKDAEGDEGLKFELDGGMREDIVNFAFSPAARREYRYKIVGRQLLGDHLIYRIAFEPLSALEVFKPSGTVWVDTRDFVIVRQEITFRQSPIPLFMRGIKRMVVEREPIGNTWVLSRILARIDMTVPMPMVGRSFDLGVSFTEYALNTGLDDSLFVRPGKGRSKGGAK